MNLFDTLTQYHKRLTGYGLNITFLISEELKKVRMPFSKQGQLEIFDLIVVYFFRRLPHPNGIELSFNLEVKCEKCIITIKAETSYEASNSPEVQEFFWFIHLIFKDLLQEKDLRAWGLYNQNKFKVQIPVWCKYA